jgi:hypothetical protein
MDKIILSGLDFSSIYIFGDKQNMLVTIGSEHVKNGHYYLEKNPDQFWFSCLCFFLLDSILRVAFKIHTIEPPEHKAQTSISKQSRITCMEVLAKQCTFRY